jgi:hypothetical protein
MLLSLRLRLPSYSFAKPHVVASYKHLKGIVCVKVNVIKHKHDIFNFKVDRERGEAVIQQINMHGGLNHLLTKHGHCPLETCKQAIEEAFALGLICVYTYKECIEINKKSNKAKHHWS